MEAFAMNTSQHNEAEIRLGDLLVGEKANHAFLVDLGMPEDTDVYYLKRTGNLPIGNTSGAGGKLIASRRKLASYTEQLTRGSSAA
jgi:hypothetical protein